MYRNMMKVNTKQPKETALHILTVTMMGKIYGLLLKKVIWSNTKDKIMKQRQCCNG